MFALFPLSVYLCHCPLLLLLVLYYWTYQCSTYMAGRVSVNEGRWESISHPLCLVTNP